MNFELYLKDEWVQKQVDRELQRGSRGEAFGSQFGWFEMSVSENPEIRD